MVRFCATGTGQSYFSRTVVVLVDVAVPTSFVTLIDADPAFPPVNVTPSYHSAAISPGGKVIVDGPEKLKIVVDPCFTVRLTLMTPVGAAEVDSTIH